MEGVKKSRKRKKTYLAKAKKFSKKGRYAKGTHLDDETYSYFMGILEKKIDSIKDEEEKVLISNNALKQAEGQEVTLAMNQLTSRVIESLLPYADASILKKFIVALSDLRKLCSDNFASFVIQALVRVCSSRFRANGDQELKSFVLKVSSFVFNNLDEFIYSPYANQVGRTCIKECSGYEGQDGLSPELVENLGNRILKFPQIKDMCNEPLTSAFLQSLLIHLSTVSKKIANKIIKQILNECLLCNLESIEEDEKKDSTATLPILFESKPLTLLLEAIIQSANKKSYTKLLIHIFLNRLKVLSCDTSSSIAVQKLISHCIEPSELKLILIELTPAFPDLIKIGRLEVILEIAKACTRLNVSEGEFLKGLKEAVQVSNNTCGELVMKLLFLSETDNILNMQGSLLIQSLLHFKKPIFVVESLLSIDTDKLKEIFMDRKGSYIANAFMESKTIGEKSRERLMNKFKGHYLELGTDKFGSRVVEAFWSRASLKEKQSIMSELNRSLSKTMFGSILGQKLNLELYLKDKAKWASKESASPKKSLTKILEQ